MIIFCHWISPGPTTQGFIISHIDMHVRSCILSAIAHKRYQITCLVFEHGCSICLLSFRSRYLPFIVEGGGGHSNWPRSSYRGLNAHFLRMDARSISSCCNLYVVVALDMRVTLSHPVSRSNRMLIVRVPRNQVYTHTIQNMDTKIPMSIYIIYYQIMSLQKTNSNTLGSIAAERNYNSTGNQLRVIARIDHHIIVLPSLLQLVSSMFE
jgi:hypothetical protein